jgi:hypothetical protein
MKHMILRLAVVAALSAATLSAMPDKQTFTGIITDDMCGIDGHAQMRMGPTDPECARACISAHGALYVLYVGNSVYILSDQKTPAKFAAQRATVTGTLDTKTKTIQVESITAAK